MTTCRGWRRLLKSNAATTRLWIRDGASRKTWKGAKLLQASYLEAEALLSCLVRPWSVKEVKLCWQDRLTGQGSEGGRDCEDVLVKYCVTALANLHIQRVQLVADGCCPCNIDVMVRRKFDGARQVRGNFSTLYWPMVHEAPRTSEFSGAPKSLSKPRQGKISPLKRW